MSPAATDIFHMTHALKLARHAWRKHQEVPVGAVVVHPELGIVGRGYNLREKAQQATAHAELLAIRRACQQLGRWRLFDCTLYVTLEPCFMCAGAIVLARIPRVVYGATDPKAGAVQSLAQVLEDPRLNHRCEVVSGVLQGPCAQVLKDFFKERRKKYPSKG